MVQSAGNGARDAIREQILTKATELLEKHSSFEEIHKIDTVLKNTDGKDCKVSLVTTRTWDTEKLCYCLVTKGHVEGLTIAGFKANRDQMAEHMKKMTNKHFEPHILDPPAGADALLLININLPFPMSNRSFMNCLYFNDTSEGTYW